MNFVRSSLLTMISVVIRAVAAVGINKLFAIQFGAAGVTLLSHFQNLAGILIAIPNDGINRGMIKYASSDDTEKRTKAWQAGWCWQLGIAAISVFVLLFFRRYLLEQFGATEQPLWFVVLLAGFILYALHFFLLAILLSQQQLRLHTQINVAGSVIVLSVCILTWKFADLSLLWSLAYFWAGTAAVGFVSVLYVGTKGLRLPKNIEDLPLKAIGGYVFTALAVLVFGRVIDFLVRAYAIADFDAQQTGWWQAVAKIGDIYILPTTAVITNVFYPRVTNILHDKMQVRSYVSEVMRWVIPLAVVGFSTVFFMKEFVLVWVNAQGFEQAAFLMKYQLAGDFLRVISYFFASLVMAQARVKLMLGMEILSATVYLSSIAILVPMFGVEGICMSHVVRYVIYTSTLYGIYRYHFVANSK